MQNGQHERPNQDTHEFGSSRSPSIPASSWAHTDTILLILFVGLIGLTRIGPLHNFDLHWHLKVGQIIIDTQSLPNEDPLTYTATGRPWIHHEWLSQVVLGEFDRIAGGTGLRALRGILVALTLLAWGLVLRRRITLLPTLILLTLAWICMQRHAVMRPHLLGWAMLAWMTYAVLDRQRPWRWTQWLLFSGTLIFWANMHASVLIVVALCGLQFLWVCIEHRRLHRTVMHHGAIFLTTVLCSLAQPAGLRLFSYALVSAQQNRTWSMEWWPLITAETWHNYPLTLGAYAVCTLCVLIALFHALRHRQLFATDAAFPAPIIAIAALVYAAYTRRMLFLVPLALVYAAPLLARIVRARLSQRARVATGVHRALQGAIVITAISLSLPHDGRLFAKKHLSPDIYPETAVQFLDAVNLHGHMFNPSGWGGFLSYYLYPKYKTFIDGRWVLAGKKVYADSVAMSLRATGSETIFDEHAIAFMIEPLWLHYRAPAVHPAFWRLAYVDKVGVVLLRNGPEFQENIRRVCQYYRNHPDWAKHAMWPVHLKSRTRLPTPTDVQSALSLCETP